MWILVLFDLPVTTKTERAKATHFRNALLDLGFEMVQFSVYIKLLRRSRAVQPRRHKSLGQKNKALNVELNLPASEVSGDPRHL